MPARRFSAPGRFVALWCLGLALAASAANAQTPTVTLAQPVLQDSEDLAAVIEKGSRLERERRWAEALSHYEDALRHHPQHPQSKVLQHRVTVARAHYDVRRRYNDQSYSTARRTLSERDALAVYDEVLLKVQSHFVHEPQWQRLLYSGMTSMEVAVTEPLFVEKNLPAIPISRLTELQREVRDLTTGRPVADRGQAHDLVRTVAATLKSRYGLSAQAVILEFTSGAAAALDEYSGFLAGGQMDEVFSQIEGNFVGLGVELKTDPSGLSIVSVIPGGPAHVGGIRPGDSIIAVDSKSIPETAPDTLADMLRGVEGSAVQVAVRDREGSLRQLSLTRRRVEIPSVEHVRIADPEHGIGYFKLTSFQKTTSRDVDAALWKLHEEGMRHLLIDLRGNPGGLLKAAVDVADKFVYDGLIVATRGRSPREDFDHRGESAGTWRVPLIVLIDHDSASASEILAGAIRDHRRGTVVGEKSYGKGSVQGIFPLASANVGVRLTTAKWYTPAGQAIQGAGIKPDLEVRSAAKPVEGQLSPGGSADPVLEAALALARTQASSRRMTP